MLKLLNTMLILLLLAATPAWAAQEADEEDSGPATVTDRIVDRFMALDSDKSDGVSYSEYRAFIDERIRQRYKAMDDNHDGEVTRDEYEAFWKARKSQYYRIKR